MSNTSYFGPPHSGKQITKNDIIIDAYSMLRISGLTVNPTPEDLEVAINRLEDMAAEWQGRNLQANYQFEPTPDPSTDSGINPAYKRAFSNGLALNLVPDFNKQVPIQLIQNAKASMSSLSGMIAKDRINGIAYPQRQPVGAGNLNYGTRWAKFYREQNAYVNTANSNRIFVGDIEDYEENFESYLDLDTFETISSFSIEVDSGLTLISSDYKDDDLTSLVYRIQADSNQTRIGANNASQSQVTIIITTSMSRVHTRRVLFAVYDRG